MRSASTPTVRGTAVSRGSPRPIASARRASARWRAAAFWASFERVASSAATSGAPRAASASFCHSPTYHASWRRPFPSPLRAAGFALGPTSATDSRAQLPARSTADPPDRVAARLGLREIAEETADPRAPGWSRRAHGRVAPWAAVRSARALDGWATDHLGFAATVRRVGGRIPGGLSRAGARRTPSSTSGEPGRLRSSA